MCRGCRRFGQPWHNVASGKSLEYNIPSLARSPPACATQELFMSNLDYACIPEWCSHSRSFRTRKKTFALVMAACDATCRYGGMQNSHKKNCPPVTTVLPRNEQSKLQAPFFPEGIKKLLGAGSVVRYTPAGCWSSWMQIQLASSLQ